MEQLTCTGKNQVEWRDVAEPKLLNDHDAIVRPLAVARCEIDPLLTSGLFSANGPFALGHEA
jgi:alcohol dehydrogenase